MRAREGRVELVELGTDADLASGYVPTGTAWRAVLTASGRVLLYPVRPVALTGRERQVAELAAAGMTSKQIARQLCVALGRPCRCRLRGQLDGAGHLGVDVLVVATVLLRVQQR